jgi:Kdo2-lipid IVA lauroyltransferase/acyltransferase
MYYIVYALLWLVSLIPFWVIYGIADFIYVIVYYIFGYRKDVVFSNLKIAFPEKTEIEHTQIAKQFYHNMIDAFLESIKFITLSEKQLLKRSSGEYDILNNFIHQGKNIHIMAGHQFNWEYANLIYAKYLNAPFVGVYMPLSNKILNTIFLNFRKRYGTILISATDFKSKKNDIFNKQYVLALAADQNPGNPTLSYWFNFFGRAVPFVTGPGNSASKNNTSVVMVSFNKVKRGHYHFSSQILAEEGAKYTPQQLTRLYKNALEETIKKDPANYLWSHKRFKYEWKPDYSPILN